MKSLRDRKIQNVIDSGGYRVMPDATVLVNKDGHIAIVNNGGAFYWASNEAISWEYRNNTTETNK